MASRRETDNTAASTSDDGQCLGHVVQEESTNTPAPSQEAAEASPSQDDDENRRDGVAAHGLVPDDSDTRGLGLGRRVEDVRPEANTSVGRDAAYYKMDHKRRGQAIILVYDKFDDPRLPERPCAQYDTNITKRAFKHLGFDVTEHWNLTTAALLKKLQEVGRHHHDDSDCLVLVFMSHGGVSDNREYLCTYDSKINTELLWQHFTADKCKSLAGKPKLFFIQALQACRGDNTDRGVQMRPAVKRRGLTVQVDSADSTNQYVIPLHADILMMWASYPGMYAFKSYRNDISGSVFIHFLAKVLEEDGRTCDLHTMLLRVTREVATRYESFMPRTELDQTKQMPYVVSTLMRKVLLPTWT